MFAGHALGSYMGAICAFSECIFVFFSDIVKAGQSRATRLPCAALALEAKAGHTPAIRPALEQQGVTMLFLQLNPWSTEERHFIFNHLRWCFTRYTALSEKFVFILLKLCPNI